MASVTVPDTTSVAEVSISRSRLVFEWPSTYQSTARLVWQFQSRVRGWFLNGIIKSSALDTIYKFQSRVRGWFLNGGDLLHVQLVLIQFQSRVRGWFLNGHRRLGEWQRSYCFNLAFEVGF